MIHFSGNGLHFFDRIAIYKCSYLVMETKEYWTGHQRKRIAKLGSFTVWMRITNDPKPSKGSDR